LTPQEPTSPRNRRISLVLIRGSYFRDPKSPATTPGILSVSDPKPAKPVAAKTVAPIVEEKKEVPISGTSIFNPTPKLEKPGINIKELKPGLEERPELNLPSPKPQPLQKKAEPVLPEEDKDAPRVSGDSIFNPAAPTEKPVLLKENSDARDERPELHLPAVKAESAKKPVPRKPAEEKRPATSLFDMAPAPDGEGLVPAENDIPPVLQITP
jgi:hypothetical protein